MKKLFLKIAGTAAMAFALATVAVAVPINGTFTLTGDLQQSGPVGFTFDSATGVSAWSSILVNNVQGDFSPFLATGDTLTIKAPWSFNSGSVPDFWTASGFHFDLISSSVAFQSATSLAVYGTGTVWGNGFDPTPGVWNFSTQSIAANNMFSFSAAVGTGAAASVPDGGLTLLFLGGGLVGLSLIARHHKPNAI
jgi:hypothetical protein